LENGGTSGYVGYDGVTFFNDSHVLGDSGAQDNDTTTDITTPAAPTTAELIAAIKLMTAALLGFKNDQGMPKNLSLSSLKLIVPGGMYWAAVEALGAALVSGGSNVLQNAAGVLLDPYLTSTDHCYLAKTDGIVKPFIFQDREPVEFKSIAEGTEQEFNQEKYSYGCRARYAIAYGEPLSIVRHTFT